VDQPTNHPIAKQLSEVGQAVRCRLQDSERELDNRDILWSMLALIEVMGAHFEYAVITRKLVDKLTHPEAKPLTILDRIGARVLDVLVTAIAGLVVLMLYWLFVRATQSGISIPTP